MSTLRTIHTINCTITVPSIMRGKQTKKAVVYVVLFTNQLFIKKEKI